MLSPASPSADQAGQAARLRRFLRWFFVLGLPFGLLELLSGILLRAMPLALVGGLTLSVLGIGVWARRLLTRGALKPAVLILCVDFLFAVISATLIFPATGYGINDPIPKSARAQMPVEDQCRFGRNS